MLHRTEPWPGGSDGVPDYICVVEVTDLSLWSAGAAESIIESHGSLGSLVQEIGMVVAGSALEPATGRRSAR